MNQVKPLFCHQCGSQLPDESQFCPNCGVPRDFIPQVVQPDLQDQAATQSPGQYPYQPQYQQPYGSSHESYQQQTAASRQNTRFVLFWIAYAILLLLIVLIFILMKTSWIGWLTALAVTAGSFYIQLKTPKMGYTTNLVVFLVTLAIVLSSFLFTTELNKRDDNVQYATTVLTTTVTSQTQPTSQTTTADQKTDEKSSIVSTGVSLDDLGNITNGQYFFDDGKSQFYSSFDKNGAAHIYRTDNASQKTTILFDGFGWSLVVYKDWLYFSGNAGKIIDGTYNLFRIRLDGSSLENINTNYCYGMSIYQNHIYYITRSSQSSSDYTICRSQLDGSEEQILVTDFNGYAVVFEASLYYCGKDGSFYRAKLDGSDPTHIINDSVYMAIIGNGKIIYTDTAGNIKIADINGQNSQLIRSAGTMPVASVNSQKDTIFYTVYDPNFKSDRYAYAYELYRVSFDGSGDQKIYESISNGIYINIINSKVYALDYAIDIAEGNMPAIAKSMGFNGDNVVELYR